MEVPAEFRRESLLQSSSNDHVRCGVCRRQCLVRPGGLGWCRTRFNDGGRLYTMIYGAVSSLAANPIEKKPFYHFHPGSQTLTAGSWSCNFGCPWCQNWDISKTVSLRSSRYISPRRFVDLTREEGCQGTSISFNEPTLSLEWSIDVLRTARARGLYNTFVSNGYMTAESLALLADAGLDAMNVDIKGDAPALWKHCKGIRVEGVWENCRLARSLGIHIEITTLVIPTVNDSDSVLRGIAERIRSDLGSEIPWHVTAYYPAWRFEAPPTSVRTIERAWEIGRSAGLDFVYVGNVRGGELENTRCPACAALLIRRRGYDILLNSIVNGGCRHCGRAIPGVWE